MKIASITLGMIQEIAYFIIDEASKRAFVVDPGDEAEKLIKYINQENLVLEKILLTHGHFDHIGAVEKLREATGAKVVAHAEGKKYLEDPSYNLSGNMGATFTVSADEYVEDSDHIVMEGTDIDLKVIHAPGHTLDGVGFYSEEYGVIFVGDIIFRGAIGRTDFKGGNTVDLLTNIKSKIFTLPEDVAIYPGHGPATTVQYEKNNNPYFNMFE